MGTRGEASLTPDDQKSREGPGAALPLGIVKGLQHIYFLLIALGFGSAS